MKIFITVLCLLVPVVAGAQSPGMNGGDMQKLMMVMQEMQACMEKIDQSKLKALEQESEKFEREIDALCKQGERDEAQKRAMAYAKKMSEDPTLQQYQECGKKAQGMMPPGTADSSPMMDQDFDYSKHHICDEAR